MANLQNISNIQSLIQMSYNSEDVKDWKSEDKIVFVTLVPHANITQHNTEVVFKNKSDLIDFRLISKDDLTTTMTKTKLENMDLVDFVNTLGSSMLVDYHIINKNLAITLVTNDNTKDKKRIVKFYEQNTREEITDEDMFNTLKNLGIYYVVLLNVTQKDIKILKLPGNNMLYALLSMSMPNRFENTKISGSDKNKHVRFLPDKDMALKDMETFVRKLGELGDIAILCRPKMLDNVLVPTKKGNVPIGVLVQKYEESVMGGNNINMQNPNIYSSPFGQMNGLFRPGMQLNGCMIQPVGIPDFIKMQIRDTVNLKLQQALAPGSCTIENLGNGYVKCTLKVDGNAFVGFGANPELAKDNALLRCKDTLVSVMVGI